MLLQIGVIHGGGATALQAVVHAQNNVASALGAVEDAGTITESAGRVGQNYDAVFFLVRRFEVEGAHGFDGIGDFLPVGADVLYGGGTDAAGDSAEAFDSGAILGDGVSDEVIPVDACAYAEKHGVACGLLQLWSCDAAEGNFEDEAGPSGIGDDEVAAAAEDK